MGWTVGQKLHIYIYRPIFAVYVRVYGTLSKALAKQNRTLRTCMNHMGILFYCNVQCIIHCIKCNLNLITSFYLLEHMVCACIDQYVAYVIQTCSLPCCTNMHPSCEPAFVSHSRRHRCAKPAVPCSPGCKWLSGCKEN